MARKPVWVVNRTPEMLALMASMMIS